MLSFVVLRPLSKSLNEDSPCKQEQHIQIGNETYNGSSYINQILAGSYLL